MPKVASVRKTCARCGSNGAQVGIRRALVVAGDDPHLAIRLQANLRRAEHVAGGMEGDGHLAQLVPFAVRPPLDRRALEPVPGDGQPRLGAEVGGAARSGVVGVGVGENRPRHRLPGIDVEAAAGTVEALRVKRGGRPRSPAAVWRRRGPAHSRVAGRRRSSTTRRSPRTVQGRKASTRSVPLRSRRMPAVSTVLTAATATAMTASRLAPPRALHRDPERGKGQDEVGAPGQRRGEEHRQAGETEGRSHVASAGQHRRPEAERRRRLGDPQQRGPGLHPEPSGDVEQRRWGVPAGWGRSPTSTRAALHQRLPAADLLQAGGEAEPEEVDGPGQRRRRRQRSARARHRRWTAKKSTASTAGGLLSVARPRAVPPRSMAPTAAAARQRRPSSQRSICP